MTHISTLRRACCFAIALGLPLLAASAEAEVKPGDTVGGFVRITGNVSGALPDRTPKAKAVKSPALFGEQIITDKSGTATVGFIDRSHLFISKGSTIVIDAFVFNPKNGQEVAHYTLKEGAIRLISGAIKGDALRINTPDATLIVRGTNVKISTSTGKTLVSVNEGLVQIRASGSHKQVAVRAGQHVSVDRDGVGAVGNGSIDVGDQSIDDAALDGDPDVDNVDLADLGFSEQEVTDIDEAADEAENADSDSASDDSSEGESGDADAGDGGDSGDSGDSSDGGDSGDSGGDSSGDSGGDGDGGGGDGGGGGGE